ncbi:MAG TPA: clostripain-related cysteine peptidase [Anaerolineales bacterium]|nr:clostripain-related cysteine peptidase [Anaerolineales bacterium]
MKFKVERLLKVILALIIITSMLTACGAPAEEGLEETETEMTEAPDGEEAPTEEATTEENTVQAPQGEPGTWLVMLYQNADDEILEQDIFIDLNEAEVVGSTDQVKIVSQIDRFNGAYDGDGDWISTKRYFVTQDDNLESIASEELEDLGELDSGDSATLVEFAKWAITTYPAEHYVLILSDHGAGWTGGWNDNDPVEGSSFKMQDIDDALGQIIAETGIEAFEFVGFDACLMGQLEVMSAIAPHARYSVGSEETEPSLGWAYASFLTALNENPAMNGGELGQIIVDSYLNQDFRITDDAARSVFSGGDFSADSVASELLKGSTLTAVDLSAMQDLNAAVNDLAVALMNVDQDAVAEARAYAQGYESVFGDEQPASFIDLGHFVDLLASSIDDPNLAQAIDGVKSALSASILAEKHGDERPGSSGLTIYFPNSELYDGTFGDEPAFGILYSAYIGRFAAASLWDDFLTYHYTGKAFDPASADLSMVTPAQASQTDFSAAIEESAPQESAAVVAPGSGEITIAPIEISASEIGPDGTVTLNTEITGSNVAYVYYSVSYLFEADGSYLTADQGYLGAEEIKEIGGVFYPDWGDTGVIPISFDWEPTLYYMSDGNEANDQFAFFKPTVYGTEVDTYTVRGTYTFANSGNKIDAEINFYGTEMQSVWGFNGDNNSAGAWREITPTPGDTFTITDEWLEFTNNPDGEFVDYEGGTITFGDTPFTMVPYYAYPGQYTLAIGVEDFDGNTIWEFTEVTVTE